MLEYKYVCGKMLLYLQENILFIQEIQEEPAGHYISGSIDQVAYIFRTQGDHAPQEKVRYLPEVDDRLRQINGDRVKAYYPEEKRPAGMTLYIDDIVEDRKIDQGIGGKYANKWTGP